MCDLILVKLAPTVIKDIVFTRLFRWPWTLTFWP